MRTLKNAKSSKMRLTIPMTAAAVFATLGIGTAMTHNNANAAQTQGSQTQAALHDTAANQVMATRTLNNGANHTSASAAPAAPVSSAPQVGATAAQSSSPQLGADENANQTNGSTNDNNETNDNGDNNNNTGTDSTNDDGDDNNNNPSNNNVVPNHTVVNNNDHDYYGYNGNDHDDADDAALVAAINKDNQDQEAQMADTEAEINDNDKNAGLAREQSQDQANETQQTSLTNQEDQNSAAEKQAELSEANNSEANSLKTSAEIASMNTSYNDSKTAASNMTSMENSIAASEGQLQSAQNSNRAGVQSAAQSAIDTVNGANNLTDAQRSQILDQIQAGENQLDAQIAGASAIDQLAGLTGQLQTMFGKAANQAQDDQTRNTDADHQSANGSVNGAIDSAANVIRGNSNLTDGQKNSIISNMNSAAGEARNEIGQATSSAALEQLVNSLASNVNGITSSASAQGVSNRNAYVSEADSNVNADRNHTVNSINANTNLKDPQKKQLVSQADSVANSKLNDINYSTGIPSTFTPKGMLAAMAPSANQSDNHSGHALLSGTRQLGSTRQLGANHQNKKMLGLSAPTAADPNVHTSYRPLGPTEPGNNVSGYTPNGQNLLYGGDDDGFSSALDSLTASQPAAGDPFNTGQGGNDGPLASLTSETVSMENSNRDQTQTAADGQIDSLTDSLITSVNNDPNLTSAARDSLTSGIYSEETADKSGIAGAAYIPNIDSYQANLNSFASNDASAATQQTTTANRWFQNDPYNPTEEAPKGYHYNANGQLLSNDTEKGPNADKVMSDEAAGIDDDSLSDDGYSLKYQKAYKYFSGIYGSGSPVTAEAASWYATNGTAPYDYNAWGFNPYFMNGWNNPYFAGNYANPYALGNWNYDPYAYGNWGADPYVAAGYGVNPRVATYGTYGDYVAANNNLAANYGAPFGDPYDYSVNAAYNAGVNAGDANAAYDADIDADNVNTAYNAGVDAGVDADVYADADLDANYNAELDADADLDAQADLQANADLDAASYLTGGLDVNPYLVGDLGLDNYLANSVAYGPYLGDAAYNYVDASLGKDLGFANPLTLANPILSAKATYSAKYLAGYKPVIKGYFTPFGEAYGFNYKPVVKTAKESINDPVLANPLMNYLGDPINFGLPQFSYSAKYVAGYKPVVKGFYTPFGPQYRLSYKPVIKTAKMPQFKYTTKYVSGYKPVVKGYYTAFGKAYSLSYKPVVKSLSTYGNWLTGPAAMTLNGQMMLQPVSGVAPVVSGAYVAKGAVIPTSLINFQPYSYYYGVPYMTINGIMYTQVGNNLVPMSSVYPQYFVGGQPVAGVASNVSSGASASVNGGSAQSVNNNVNANAVGQSANNSQKGKLPQTGEQVDGSFAAALGLALIGLSLAGVDLANKKRENA